MEEWVSVTEATTQSSYIHEHITWLARKGKITARKTGGVWLVDLKSLKAYEQRMSTLGTQRHSPTRDEQ